MNHIVIFVHVRAAKTGLGEAHAKLSAFKTRKARQEFITKYSHLWTSYQEFDAINDGYETDLLKPAMMNEIFYDGDAT